jgi:HAD superfamily phosphatase (TIGR01681 family)
MYKDKLNKYNEKLYNLIGGAEPAPEPVPAQEPKPVPVQEPEQIPAEAPRQRSAIFSEGPNPSLFVFDCDYTIWPFDCHGPEPTDPQPPYIRAADGHVYGGNPYIYHATIPANPYPNVPNILGALYDAGIQVAFASRNRSAGHIKALLRAIPLQSQHPGLTLWDCLRDKGELFHAYSSGHQNNKLAHFINISSRSGVTYPNMVFFDDNKHNIDHSKSIGIISILLSKETGLTWDAIDDVVRTWRARQASAP